MPSNTRAFAPHDPARFAGSSIIVPVLLGLVLIVAVGTAFGQSGPSPEGLTQRLVALGAQYRAANPADQPQLLVNLLSVAGARERLLASLIETNPGAVLAAAVPASVRQSLPAAVQAHVEEAVQVDGELEVLHEDRDPGSRYLYFLNSALGRLALHFAADPPTLETGDRVRATGVRLHGAMALSSGSSVTPLVTVAPNTFGPQKTILILVTFQDKPTPPYPVSTAQSVMSTTSGFYWENSYHQTSLTGVVDTSAAADVYGWFTIAQDSTVCDYNKTASLGEQAAQAAGADLSKYSRKVYAFPNNVCSWWGLGTVGGNPSRAWVNGSFQLRVVGHEMGHNVGLWHSRSESCDTTGCVISEYGNTWDMMGSSAGHFNAFQKERLGWLDYGISPPLATAQGDGVFLLLPYETWEAVWSGPKALAVLKSTDPTTSKRTWYFLEYRQKLGYDGSLTPGVIVTTGSEASGNSSNLFDLAPTTSTFDALLDVGQSYTDASAGVTLTTLSADSTGAYVRVTFGPIACVRGTPTVAMSPSGTQWVGPGSTVSYTVTVSNTDNSGCSASSFPLTVALASGWTATFTSPTLTISPGATASTTLNVAAPTSGSDGAYEIKVTATNAASSTSASTSVIERLVTSLTVGVSAHKASYNRNQVVTITTTVTSSGTPVPGAGVTVTIKKPDNSTVILGATTGSNGTALVQYRIKPKDPVSATPYSVQSTASLVGVSGTGTTSFTVAK